MYLNEIILPYLPICRLPFEVSGQTSQRIQLLIQPKKMNVKLGRYQL